MKKFLVVVMSVVFAAGLAFAADQAATGSDMVKKDNATMTDNVTGSTTIPAPAVSAK